MIPLPFTIDRLLAGLAVGASLMLASLPAKAQLTVTDQVTLGGIPFRYAHLPRSRSQVIQFGWRDGFAMSQGDGQAVGSWASTLMLQGPQGSSPGEFAEDAKDAQARLSLTSGITGTAGSVIAPPDKFDAAVDLMAKALYEPALDASRLHDMQQSRLAAIAQARVKAETLAGDVANFLFLPPGPLRRWRLGDPAMVRGVTIPGIEAWRKAVLARDGMKVAASGPAGVDAAARQIDRLLGRLPTAGAERKKPDFPRRDAEKTALLIADVPQTFVLIGGWSGVERSPDHPSVELATAILKTRLFKAVREKLGAAYGASASLFFLGPEQHFLSLRAAVEHDKAAAALEAMRSEFARFLADGITSEELEPEKAKLISETREGMRRAPNVARLLRGSMLDGFADDYVATFEQRLSAIAVEKINDTIRTKLAGRPTSTIIVAPSAGPFKTDCIIKKPEEAETC